MFFPRAEISGTGAELRHSVLMLALVIALRRAASPSPGASAALAAAGCWAETSCTRASGSAYKWLLPTRELNRLFCFFRLERYISVSWTNFPFAHKKGKSFQPLWQVERGSGCDPGPPVSWSSLWPHFPTSETDIITGAPDDADVLLWVGGTRRKGQVAPSLPLKDRHSQCSTRPLGRGSSHRARFFPLVRNWLSGCTCIQMLWSLRNHRGQCKKKYKLLGEEKASGKQYPIIIIKAWYSLCIFLRSVDFWSEKDLEITTWIFFYIQDLDSAVTGLCSSKPAVKPRAPMAVMSGCKGNSAMTNTLSTKYIQK